MMRDDYCHNTLVLDSSGSMSGCWDETLQSIKQYIEDQKKVPGKMTFSLYVFDTTVRRVIDFVDIQHLDVDGLIKGLKASGWTAMWDSVKQSIDETGVRLGGLPESERPTKVVMVYLTDGQENWSKFCDANTARWMIQHQKEKYNWQFAFLGADFDVTKDAKTVGVQSFNYSKFETAGIIGKGLSNSVKMYRQASPAASYDVSNIK